MVYSNKFVLCVLLNGIPQEEKANGTVVLPFNVEYELRLRNKHSRRAVVQLYIDGENVSGGGYVIGANSYIDIKRHNDIDRAFKFVDLDSPEAIDQGKNGPNIDKKNGTIEARFYLEKEHKSLSTIVHEHLIREQWIEPKSIYPNPNIIWSGPQYNSVSCSIEYSQPTAYNFIGGSSLSHVNIKDGCTVEGQSTGQQFYGVNIDIEDTFTSIKIFLQGYKNNVNYCRKGKIIQNSTIKHCDKCGANFRKKNSKFCHKCGNKL